MWTLRRCDLKYRLTLRVVVVSAFCFFATSAYFLFDVDRAARAGTDRLAEITAKALELQKNKQNWLKSPLSEFPDLQTVATALMAPGVCIAYRVGNADILQRVCSGPETGRTGPPKAFVALYHKVFDPGREAVHSVLFRGEKVGEAVAWIDPATLTADAWREAGRLIVAMAVTLPLLSALVYAALARALRPTRLIQAGLERIAANDLATRLPPFDLAELSAVRDVFNHLAESLGTALAERRELTRRLIALQDEERRHLARELHDEFGQCLAAIRALAASAGQSSQDCPGVRSECDSIARTATHMMETLRGTLFRLRPPDIDELGLGASLEALVAGWNGRSRGRARFDIRLCGRFDGLPGILSTNLYRIAQEALTNAAKHAEATRVVLSLTMREARFTHNDQAHQEVELVVEDDGLAGDHDQPVRSGMGLLGMRERVATLGGVLSFEAERKAGSKLRVVIPVLSIESEPPALSIATRLTAPESLSVGA
jgi:signal transduction histidine kinase